MLTKLEKLSDYLGNESQPNCQTKVSQIAKRKSAKLPNESRPNCQTKVGQIAKRKSAKLPNYIKRCLIYKDLYYLCSIIEIDKKDGRIQEKNCR